MDSDVWKEGVSLPKRYVEFQEKDFYEIMIIIGCGSDTENQLLFQSFSGKRS